MSHGLFQWSPSLQGHNQEERHMSSSAQKRTEKNSLIKSTHQPQTMQYSNEKDYLNSPVTAAPVQFCHLAYVMDCVVYC